MPALDHVNIQTARLAETVAFWRDVIGLEPRDAPGGDPAISRWMHDEQGRAIIHLAPPGSLFGERPAEISDRTGAVHHVALDCIDHAAILARLEAHGLPYRRNHVPQIDLKQIFVRDPNGVLVEMNFRPGRQ